MKKSGWVNLDRRSFLLGAGGAGLLAATGGGLSMGQGQTPKRGGQLRMGIGGGSTADNFDPKLLSDDLPLMQGFMVMSRLISVDDDNQAEPQLFESWEPDAKAENWIFNLRKGVEFHNGKTVTVDDVLYSLNIHRGETTSGARTVASELTEVEKMSDSQIRIRLAQPNADLPFVLSDYHFLIIPEGWTDYNNPIGTGPFILETSQPGVRASFKRNPNYWLEGPFVDEVEVIVINDIAARTNALISGEVDAINQLDYKTVELLARNPNISAVQSSGGLHFPFSMNCTAAPFDDVNVRLAIKYAIDREQLLATAFRGFGSLGNDHPIPSYNRFYNSALEQRAYDPDKAKFYLKQAGLSDLKIQLSASDAAFPGAVDAAAVFRLSAAQSGIDLTIKREPVDGYWDSVWMNVPFCMTYRGGRVTADQSLAIAYASNSAQNDTNWREERFDKLLFEARGSLDEAKRREMYYELQAMVSNEGGQMIPVFGDYLDAVSNRVQGAKPSSLFRLMGFRMAEKVWLD